MDVGDVHCNAFVQLAISCTLNMHNDRGDPFVNVLKESDAVKVESCPLNLQVDTCVNRKATIDDDAKLYMKEIAPFGSCYSKKNSQLLCFNLSCSTGDYLTV